ncbi:flagellar biosynthetic protein FlhB [Rhodovulum iodosum]|uniref:Flagellar biosynthetic protein FlhB n=1 Tax=Rhodovulum iodosum TaxID=68291 RepID=A0ABV3XT19_9RHOB|nr:flagellar type III secretion system protein FlhB [Rhodovulum robiginosum]RSK40027.1 flagellar biosynthesis protein FlhB [Rhodovulum robiginosum]
MSETADKPHAPTGKKLEEARRKGDIARSTDLNTAAAYAGLVLTGLVAGGGALAGLGGLGAGVLQRADTLSALMFDGAARPPVGGLMASVAQQAAPWFAGPAAAVLLSVLAQRSLVVAPEKLRPKLSRLSPIATAGQKFGRSGLFEFSKSTVKLVIYAVLLGLYLSARLDRLLLTMRLGAEPAVAVLLRLSVEFLMVAAMVALAIGGVDFLWQRAELERRNRMTHQEVRDEIKQSEGDPHLKQTRRARGRDIATNRMLGDVPKADVVIVNPQHYAVALMWSPEMATAPVCLAKGADEVAARIRQAAAAAGVPIRRDPPTARALFATVEIGAPVPPAQYRAVAAAIRFAEAMRVRARSGR